MDIEEKNAFKRKEKKRHAWGEKKVMEKRIYIETFRGKMRHFSQRAAQSGG